MLFERIGMDKRILRNSSVDEDQNVRTVYMIQKGIYAGPNYLCVLLYISSLGIG